MSDKRYWKSLEELDARAEQAERDERASLLEEPIGRRGFLTASGFTLASGVLGGCSRSPVEKAIPYLEQPDDIVPGRAAWYATTCGGCSARCGVLAKTRDGRPIKLEGNPVHTFSTGGLCAVGQASLVELYDSHRLRAPRFQGQEVGWDEVDEAVEASIEETIATGGRVRFLTDTVTSPTEQRLIDRFLRQVPDARHVVYDPLSSSAILDAHLATHGGRILPRYDFSQADVIVSFGADFLGTWISPVEYTAAYRRGRDLDGDWPNLSYHAQLEGRMSLTGSNADLRAVVDPGDVGLILSQLTAKVEVLVGADPAGGAGAASTSPALEESVLEDLAHRLWEADGRALVVSGSQSVQEQVLVNYLNELVGAYGKTLDVERPSYQRQGDDRQLADLIQEIRNGDVDLLLIRGVNPVFDSPAPELAEALDAAPMVISFSGAMDETAVRADVICPEPHYLEAWSDSEAVAGVVSIAQPAMQPLGRTRTMAESLSVWLGEPAASLDLIQDCWRDEILPRLPESGSFQTFWDRTVHDGFAHVDVGGSIVVPFDPSTVQVISDGADGDLYTLELYPKVGMLDGRHAHNPWLQELPDPVTKVVWDNYACLSPRTAEHLGVAQNDVVRLEVPDGAALELPVYVQPGQHDRVVAVALGYGRAGTDRFSAVAPKWLEGKPTVAPGATVGSNAASLASPEGGHLRSGLEVTPTGATHDLATTQIYHYLSVPEKLAPTDGKDRPIIQETTLPAFVEDRSAGKPHLHHFDSDLWGEHEFETHHWAMAVDLSACTGCAACVVSCQAENNVPVVGKDEVKRRREMHWIRIDRYFRGEEHSPDTVHQPMMCHHCDNAPCETVCPVTATLHSSEGLNMQAYNRCVGTRYCANNCPYKVRRFNWFDYVHDDRLQNLVLNPDVVVRERGVMEKCSFCVQRIQEAKFTATSQGRELADGDIQTACQQSCPAEAIDFGDLKDPASRISQMRQDPRHYLVFEELNLRPSVGYMRLVRNRPTPASTPLAEGEEDSHHG